MGASWYRVGNSSLWELRPSRASRVRLGRVRKEHGVYCAEGYGRAGFIQERAYGTLREAKAFVVGVAREAARD